MDLVVLVVNVVLVGMGHRRHGHVGLRKGRLLLRCLPSGTLVAIVRLTDLLKNIDIIWRFIDPWRVVVIFVICI